MYEPTRSIPTVPESTTSSRPRFSSRQRIAITAISTIIVIVTLIVALAPTGGAGDADSSTAQSPVEQVAEPGASDPESEAAEPDPGPSDEDEDELGGDDDSQGYPDGGENVEESPVEDGGADAPVDLDPVETVDEQCGSVLATGATLLVTPDPAQLEPGDMTDALTIHNCSDADVDWTAKTVPDVTLDTTAATLGGGKSTQLVFTIDSDAYDPGAIDFKIKVSEPGHNEYVDVHAFRKTFGKDVVAGGGTLSAGADAGGCANSCITKAILTPAANTADLAFEVKTHTPAKIRVWVAKQAPSGNGVPMAASPAGATHWNTVLSPLQAATEYHLLLRATDGNGKTDERTTTFTTAKPAPASNDYAAVDPKCHAQCITSAQLTPGGDYSVKHLDVSATTPVRFQAWLSTEAPTYIDDVPGFDDPDVVKVSGLEYHETWSVDLEPLEGATKYHIIVRAEDTDGEVAHRVGSFTTAPEPTVDVLVTFHELTVTHDGDSSWKNRGELSFAWAVGETTIGTRGESKMSDGDGFSFNRSKASYLATGLTAGDFLPNVRVSGSERDADGKVEFCSMGTGAATQPGRNDKCDAKWNVASAGLVSVGSIESMARCSSFGIPAPTGSDGCMLLQTPNQGDDYARFNVLVSFHLAG